MHDSQWPCFDNPRSELIARLKPLASLLEPKLSLPVDREREDGDVLRNDPAYSHREKACLALLAGDRTTSVETVRKFEACYFEVKESPSAVSVLEQSLFYILERAVAARAEDVVIDGVKFALRAQAYWTSQHKVSPILAWNIANVVIECVKAGLPVAATYGIRGLSEIYADYVYFKVRRGELADQEQAEYALVGLPNVLRQILNEASRLQRRDIIDFAMTQYCLTIKDVANYGQSDMLAATLRPWAAFFSKLLGKLMSDNLVDPYSTNPFRADIWDQCETSASVCVDVWGDALKELAAGGGLPSGWIKEYALLGQHLIAKRAADASGWPKAGQLAMRVADQLGAAAAAIKEQEYIRQATQDGLKAMLAVPGEDRLVKDIRDHVRKAMEPPKKLWETLKKEGKTARCLL